MKAVENEDLCLSRDASCAVTAAEKLCRRPAASSARAKKKWCQEQLPRTASECLFGCAMKLSDRREQIAPMCTCVAAVKECTEDCT